MHRNRNIISDLNELPEVQALKSFTQHVVLPVGEGAAIGSAIALAHPGLSFLGMVIFGGSTVGIGALTSFTSDKILYGLAYAANFALMNWELDVIIASCINALGIPVIGNPHVTDVVAKCALTGAVIGSGITIYGLYTNKQKSQTPGSSLSMSVNN